MPRLARFSMTAFSSTATGHKLVFGVWDRERDLTLFDTEGFNQEQAEFAAAILNEAARLDYERASDEAAGQ